METMWKQGGKRSPAHLPALAADKESRALSRPTYELADGVIWAGHCLDLSLEHSLSLS